MCADVLAYVGAYVRICASRGAGAYTHGRAHPRGRTHDLSVAAGLGFVYVMFIFLGRVFYRKIPLKINILGKVEQKFWEGRLQSIIAEFEDLLTDC